jgi:hypothetical protein
MDSKDETITFLIERTVAMEKKIKELELLIKFLQDEK